jgi:hypothetical protein
MADWFVRFIDVDGTFPRSEFLLGNPEVEVRNSEPGGFSGEIALGQTNRNGQALRTNEFIPYETNYEIWRQGTGSGRCISSGMLTSINLNFNRDTVLISGKDWLHYFQRRIYPFNPTDYKTYNANAKHTYWDKWPKKWPTMAPGQDQPVEITTIIKDLLLSMKTGIPIDAASGSVDRNAERALGVPNIVWNLDTTGITSTHKIFPGDSTTIFDHITKFSEMADGFEFAINPESLEFKLWSPRRRPMDIPVYRFDINVDSTDSPIIAFDWTNEGPQGTYLIGLGAGRHKVGAVWTIDKNVEVAGRHDLVYDYGETSDPDLILQKLKDQNDLWYQKKLALTLINPEFATPNFYTEGRPLELIGAAIHVNRNFSPLHKVDAYFAINAIKWSVDQSTNESVALELEMIYEPDTGASGGINEDSQ